MHASSPDRAVLVQRAADERAELQALLPRLQRPLALIDRVATTAIRIGRGPIPLLGVSLVTVLLGSRVVSRFTAQFAILRMIWSFLMRRARPQRDST